jgi:transcriptional regulator with XRE-family HTH domain
MGLGDKLRQIRLERGISQETIAKKLGQKTNSYVSMVELGRRRPSEDKLIPWGEALGLSPEEIEDLVLEAKLEELGITDPTFTVMFKDIPKMTSEEKRSIIRAYEAVRKAREAKARMRKKED